MGESYEQAEMIGSTLKCACLSEITMEHLRLGYHPPCMRIIQIVLTRMVKDQ